MQLFYIFIVTILIYFVIHFLREKIENEQLKKLNIGFLLIIVLVFIINRFWLIHDQIYISAKENVFPSGESIKNTLVSRIDYYQHKDLYSSELKNLFYDFDSYRDMFGIECRIRYYSVNDPIGKVFEYRDFSVLRDTIESDHLLFNYRVIETIVDSLGNLKEIAIIQTEKTKPRNDVDFEIQNEFEANAVQAADSQTTTYVGIYIVFVVILLIIAFMKNKKNT